MIVIAGVGRPIIEVEALIITHESAGVVVHYIEGNGDAVKVAQVHHGLQLSGSGSNVLDSHRRQALGGNQAIDGGEVSRKGGLPGYNIGCVRREIVRTVVSHGGIGFHFVDGQRLKHIDSQRYHVLNLPNHIKKS